MNSILDSIFCAVKLISVLEVKELWDELSVFTKIRLLLLSWSSAVSAASLPFLYDEVGDSWREPTTIPESEWLECPCSDQC